MANRKRILSRVHRNIARHQGVNAAAWFAGQSFTSASRGDMPLARLTIKQLDEAGAGLLPKAEEAEKAFCIYCGAPVGVGEDYCSPICVINAQGDR